MHKDYYYPSLLISLVVTICSQLLLKQGTMRSLGNSFLLFQPLIILGLLGAGIAALFYIYALKGIGLSNAYPFMAMTFIVVPLMAHFIWQEPFGLTKIISLIFISSGVLLLCL